MKRKTGKTFDRLLLVASGVLSLAADRPAAKLPQGQAPLARLINLPLAFERNDGQTDGSVRFLAHGGGGTFYFRSSDVALVFAEHSIRMRFRGGAARKIDNENELPGKVNYFIGNDARKWRAALPTYSRIAYRDLYPGVQLQYDGGSGTLKSTYTIEPGADATRVRWSYDGIEKVSIDNNGDLHVRVSDGRELIEHAPVAWQEVGGRRVVVRARYKIDKEETVRFALGRYDHTRALTIDPALTYSTYVGGSGADYGFGLALDAGGNTYVCGDTTSTDFPTSGAIQTINAGAYDVFVTKIDPSGSQVLYSTYLGGGGWDVSNSIAVDKDGNAYVTGYTESTNFPTANAIQSVNKGIPDVFVTKLNAAGSALVYSTYLGGNNLDFGNAIAVNAAGEAYLGGMTLSADFPTANAYQATNRGVINGYISKLNAAGSALVFSTYFGGSVLDRVDDMALDASGKI